MLRYPDVVAAARKIQAMVSQHRASQEESFYQPSPGLGWEITPSARHLSQGATSDALGFRSSRDPAEPADPSLPVVSFWGDSITEGGEVSDQDSWLWELQSRLRGACTVVNGGVSAYGTDQAFLRFKKMQPRVPSQYAFLCYATTDLPRNLNIQRMFLIRNCQLLFLKPRFELKGGRMELVSPPDSDFANLAEVLAAPETIALLKKHDPFFPTHPLAHPGELLAKLRRRLTGQPDQPPFWGRLYPEALEVTAGICRLFHEHCAHEGVVGGVILLPILTGSYSSGRDFDELITRLQAQGIPYYDFREAFARTDQPLSRLFTPRNHYTGAAGKVLGDYFAPLLKDLLAGR